LRSTTFTSVFRLHTGAALTITLMGMPVSAQTPAAPPAPNDTPSIQVGATIYTDYTYTVSPESTDADGNSYNPSSFNVTRSYINLNGRLSHLIGFRITPDIVRDTDAGSSLNGNLVFRIKYAFAQINLDDWMTAGSWTRLGIQQTPWVDFEENIYRYRFQGTVFVEREGFLSSSDAGASLHWNAPSNYGDVHAGFYNGENYNRTEVNNQKSFQVRGTVRPFVQSSTMWLRGLRGHVYYDADSYVEDGERNRFVASATYEHRWLNAGVDYLNTADQTLSAAAKVEAGGFSLWATPRFPHGFEALLRYDRLTPDDRQSNQTRSRTIFGAAYWFPLQGTLATALLVDVDTQTFHNITPAPPKQQRIAVHGLVNF
jgi:hypothetical protein